MSRSKLLQLIPCLVLLLCSESVTSRAAEQINIDSCYAKATRNYPLVHQFALIEQSKDYTIANISKGYLPQLNISGQATYQSAVTSLPISLPGANITPLSKDQYKIYGEVTQPLTDLFTLKDQQQLADANAQIDAQKTTVEVYKLKERVNNLYFGILLTDAQIAQANLMKNDIQAGINRTKTAIANGTALKSSADNLKAELLHADQRTIELKAARRAYLHMLSLFISETIPEDATLETPRVLLETPAINRQELKLLDLQKNALHVQNKLIADRNLPRFSLFFQGGAGRPALNFLSNDLTGYYIGGLRLNWNFSGFYTAGKEKKIIGLNSNMLDVQKEVFLFNTNLALEQQHSELQKIKELISTDDDIIALRTSIKETTQNQLAYGTATANDYIIAVNAADEARQNQLLHRIQLLLAQYTIQTTTGN